MKAYTTEEVIKYCADYIKDGKWIGLSIPLYEGRLRGRARMSHKTFVDRDYILVSETHFSVLQQLVITELPTDSHHRHHWKREKKKYAHQKVTKQSSSDYTQQTIPVVTKQSHF
jgi:hypothetical protein